MLPVAMGGVAGHKKGNPGCKAGKFDAHVNASQNYQDRMAKKKKATGGPGNTAKKGPGKPGGKKGKVGEKKHCHAFNFGKGNCAFNFGKGNCRYGAKCRFSHDKDGERNDKLQAFTPQQKKLVNL